MNALPYLLVKSVFRSGNITINHFEAANCQPLLQIRLTIGCFCAILQVIEAPTEAMKQSGGVSSEFQVKGGLGMNLRPHHLLCIQKFTGHGYNADFTDHMKSIVSELTENPKTQITVAQGCDDLCKMCPNNLSGVCTSLEKVALMDSTVLSICNLAYGDKVLWTKAAGKARERIFETDKFNTICTCCQWFELCRSTEVYYE